MNTVFTTKNVAKIGFGLAFGFYLGKKAAGYFSTIADTAFLRAFENYANKHGGITKAIYDESVSQS